MNYKLCLIGFGGVARALVDVIIQKNDIFEKQYGFTLSVVAVSDVFLGLAIDRAGLDLQSLSKVGVERGALASLPHGSCEPNNTKAIAESNSDIVVEATITNPNTGEPAISHCLQALELGKDVTTTNKGPVALGLETIMEVAEKKGCHFEYEGSVMSGTPVIRLAQNCLAGCKITGFRGILNGTTNFVLEKIEEGLKFSQAISLAQELGYAEADPTADLEGSDITLKVFILSNEIFGPGAKWSDIETLGLSTLNEDVVRSSIANGRRWKMIGEGYRTDAGKLALSIKPCELDMSDPLAAISGATNAITFETDLLGDVTISGPGAGKTETAFAMLSDIISIHKKRKCK